MYRISLKKKDRKLKLSVSSFLEGAAKFGSISYTECSFWFDGGLSLGRLLLIRLGLKSEK